MFRERFNIEVHTNTNVIGIDRAARTMVVRDLRTGAAKDPVNLAGMLAENVLNGDMPVADWLALDRTDALLVDVREPDEFAGGDIPNAMHLPLSQMRDR